MALALVPMLVMLVPVCLLLGQLSLWYEARPLRGDDYPRARAVVDGWFGHPVGLVMHRLFFDQLGPSGVWLETDEGARA